MNFSSSSLPSPQPEYCLIYLRLVTKMTQKFSWEIYQISLHPEDIRQQKVYL